MIDHDTGAASVFVAGVLELFFNNGYNLHWVVDLRDLPVYAVNEPAIGNHETWNAMLERLKTGLDLQHEGALHASTTTALCVTTTTVAGNRTLRATFSVGPPVLISFFVRGPPPMGHWLLWPQHLDLGQPALCGDWWRDDEVPF